MNEDLEDVTLITGVERPFRLENWHIEDLEMYVGGIYTKGYQSE
jgi:hypothetical protein